MNKRKMILLALSLCMVAILATGVTLAYFTDADQAVNVLTVGSVQIELIEQQRDFQNGQHVPGSALEPFEGSKKLLPIVGSAQGEKDALGLSVAKNYLDKIITVKVQEGSGDVYVRVLIAIPSALDGDDGEGVLHFDLGSDFAADIYHGPSDYANWGQAEYLHRNVPLTGEGIIEAEYNIYCFTYQQPLIQREETASACVVGFYLDEKVDADGEHYTINGRTIEYDLAQGVTIPVFAQGVQAASFEDMNGDGTAADEAFAAAGLPTNPWAD